jgi:sensor histidine kinase YesM
MRWDLTGWLIWIGLIPIVLRVGQRFPITQNNWPKRVMLFLSIGVAMALARTVSPALIYILFFEGLADLQQWLPGKFYLLITDFIVAFSFYLLVLAFGQATNYYKRYREEDLRRSQLELQLSKAQLQSLKAQLHPHFLFNTLNSISALQLEDTDAAQEMTARLGDFLRMTLENAGTQEVTLEREIEFLECYLDIEKVRFGERLTTRIEIDPELLLCRVPNLMLQPLVENSLKHGISNKASRGKINIKASRENGWLKVEVEDNGKGIEDSDLETVFTSGLGLSNTRERLERLYGSNFRFQLRNAPDGGLIAALRLPNESFEENPADSQE